MMSMVTRAPHTGASYHINNRTVWDVIRHVTHGGPAYDWVSQIAHNYDGHGAYLALKTHYLGPTFQAMIRAQADKKLDISLMDEIVDLALKVTVPYYNTRLRT
jgi:hypothetical protein